MEKEDEDTCDERKEPVLPDYTGLRVREAINKKLQFCLESEQYMANQLAEWKQAAVTNSQKEDAEKEAKVSCV